MKQVWKFPLKADDHNDVEMPEYAQLLHVREQHGTPCLWALVDPSARKVKRRVRIAGTGHNIEVDECNVYVGTVELHGGALIFHVFDLGEL